MAKKNHNSDIIFYISPVGNVNIEVIYNNESFWLSEEISATANVIYSLIINKENNA